MAEDLSNIAGMFRTNTEIVNRAIAGVPQEDWFRKPGDDSNHLMWVMGHLIVHRGRTLNVLGVDWNSSWAPLFARGAERVGDDEYPSSDEMRAAWENVSTELIRAVREAPKDLLDQSPPKGPLSFDGKLSGTVAFFAFHDAYHAGQVSYLRKWLGHGQTIG
jgi:DinB family protein